MSLRPRPAWCSVTEPAVSSTPARKRKRNETEATSVAGPAGTPERTSSELRRPSRCAEEGHRRPRTQRWVIGPQPSPLPARVNDSTNLEGCNHCGKATLLICDWRCCGVCHVFLRLFASAGGPHHEALHFRCEAFGALPALRGHEALSSHGNCWCADVRRSVTA